ncbi:hypothetical protein FI667_g1640, partial [Globisporangium splendens]
MRSHPTPELENHIMGNGEYDVDDRALWRRVADQRRTIAHRQGAYGQDAHRRTYDDLNEEHADAMEIVFVSSDENPAAFDEYYGDMPFAALPYAELELDVFGVPMFISVDDKGVVVIKKKTR